MAGIDTSIYSQFQPVRLRDPLETAANALSVQSAQQANQLNALKAQYLQDDRAAQLADEEVMRQYLAAGAGEQNLPKLATRPRAYQAEAKRLLDQRKEMSTVNKTEGETVDAALKRYRSALDFIESPQAAARWYQAQYADPVLSQFATKTLGPLEQSVGTIPTDPAQFQEWRQRIAVGMDKFLDNQRQMDNSEIIRGPDGRPQVNRPLVDARREIAEAGRAITYGSPVPVQINGQPFLAQPSSRGGPASLVRVEDPNKPGQRVPVQPGKEAGGQPTEDERRSAGLAVRMEAALRRVQEITAKDADAAKPGIAERALGAVSEDAANVARSANRQSVNTAQLDALDAALTLATGAAYTKEQLKGLASSYFPQIGDSPQVIADKQKRFNDVIQTARIRAGRSAGAIDQVLSGQRGASIPQNDPRNKEPSVNDLLKMYGG